MITDKRTFAYTKRYKPMDILPAPPFHLADAIKAIAVALGAIGLATLLQNLPVNRRHAHAVIVTVAAGSYLNGGIGIWEFPFAMLVAGCAYRGLNSYQFIGIAWLLHTGWDIVHHFTGHPMISWLPTSSAECAIKDAILAVWFFVEAPASWNSIGNKRVPFRS
jgi:hypothetical protein